jgi:DNA modification methylase
MIEPVETSRYANRDLSVFDQNLSLPRHRWYEFKEGFSEELVREAIRDASSDHRRLRILDPFAGSGTTLVTAGRTKHSATGIEVNPFLAFASQAKCAPGSRWKETAFQREVERTLEISRHEVPSPLEGRSTFTVRPGIRKWLFNRSVLRGFTALDQALDNGGIYRNPLRLALFASLIECCNAKRDGKCFRYRKKWQSLGLTSADLRAAFERRAQLVADDIVSHSFDARGLRIIEGDARECLTELGAKQFDLIVTSPPYLNSFDYSDVYRPELFAGGFVQTNDDLREIRLKTVRSHVQVSWEPSEIISSTMLPPIIEQLSAQELWDYRLPSMVQSYFADMADVLRKSAALVKPGGKAWIVVSTSAYAGIEIPVDLILADTGARNGWNLVGVYVLRQLRAAGQQWNKLESAPKKPLRESLIILRRN